MEWTDPGMMVGYNYLGISFSILTPIILLAILFFVYKIYKKL